MRCSACPRSRADAAGLGDGSGIHTESEAGTAPREEALMRYSIVRDMYATRDSDSDAREWPSGTSDLTPVDPRYPRINTSALAPWLLRRSSIVFAVRGSTPRLGAPTSSLRSPCPQRLGREGRAFKCAPSMRRAQDLAVPGSSRSLQIPIACIAPCCELRTCGCSTPTE